VGRVLTHLAFREDHHALPSTQQLFRVAEGGAVRRILPDGKRPEPAGDRANYRNGEYLRAPHVIGFAPQADPHRKWVEEAQVIRSDDHAALYRNILRAFDSEPAEDRKRDPPQ